MSVILLFVVIVAGLRWHGFFSRPTFPPNTVSPSPTEWKTYDNTRLAHSFQAPSNWTVNVDTSYSESIRHIVYRQIYELPAPRGSQISYTTMGTDAELTRCFDQGPDFDNCVDRVCRSGAIMDISVIYRKAQTLQDALLSEYSAYKDSPIRIAGKETKYWSQEEYMSNEDAAKTCKYCIVYRRFWALPNENIEYEVSEIMSAAPGTSETQKEQMKKQYQEIFDRIVLSIKLGDGSNLLQGVSSRPSGWKTFTNKQYRYVMDYPGNWPVSAKDLKGVMFGHRPYEPAGGYVTVDVYPKKTIKDIPTLPDAGYYTQPGTCDAQIETTFQNNPARIYKCSNPFAGAAEEIYFIEKFGNLYNIYFGGSLEPGNPQYNDDMDIMALRFRFL